MMGNRGCLHGPDRRLGTARWRSKLWICCVLDFKGVRRDPMPPGRWTALFFLDEATALAAGHRPCAYCRRASYEAFVETWRLAHDLDTRPRATELDAELHRQRIEPGGRRQRTYPAASGSLPDGTMIRYDGRPGLVRGASVLPWSLDGYGPAVAVPRETTVEVLTPAGTVLTLAGGYRPLLHPSAHG
jgi:hypothetical protein